jgi:putative pyruvate formate lyase activating enzyme
MVHAWANPARLALAHSHYGDCRLCEHRCHANRHVSSGHPCKAGVMPRVFRHRIEYGEEAELVPSHLFYLSGCDLRCVFCIAGINAFDPSRGRELTGELFNEAVNWGIVRGARNIQWVGGEPTIHIPAILEVMAQCPKLPPVVWKSDFYFTSEALELLDGAIDTYVADFKFGNDDCARQLAGVERYCEVITRNLLLASTRGRLIVRHLLLPGHEECCYRPIVEWMEKNLPKAAFSLREGYLPSWRARSLPQLNRPLEVDAGRRARRMAEEAHLELIT